MAVRSKSNHYHLDRILPRHWIAQGQQVGLSAAEVGRLIEEVITSTEGVIEAASKLIPNDFPLDIAEAIFSGMRAQCAKLGKG